MRCPINPLRGWKAPLTAGFQPAVLSPQTILLDLAAVENFRNVHGWLPAVQERFRSELHRVRAKSVSTKVPQAAAGSAALTRWNSFVQLSNFFKLLLIRGCRIA
jgi:hypothetical protein